MSVVWPRAARSERDLLDIAPPVEDPYVFHGGTYNGTPIALAAGLATLDLLEHEGGWQYVEQAGDRIRAALRDVFARLGCDAQVIGAGAAFDFYFTREPIRSVKEVLGSDLQTRRAVDYALLVRGIYNSPAHRFHLSTAHSETDLERTLDAIDASVRDVGREGGPGSRTPRITSHA
jgi:glutamate-1-semialdehyde 2,1-aminomutase